MVFNKIINVVIVIAIIKLVNLIKIHWYKTNCTRVKITAIELWFFSMRFHIGIFQRFNYLQKIIVQKYVKFCCKFAP